MDQYLITTTGAVHGRSFDWQPFEEPLSDSDEQCAAALIQHLTGSFGACVMDVQVARFNLEEGTSADATEDVLRIVARDWPWDDLAAHPAIERFAADGVQAWLDRVEAQTIADAEEAAHRRAERFQRVAAE